MEKKRNDIAELMRFLFCILVVGFHVQMTLIKGENSWFECGALGVEFFFVLSGLLLAKSLEKIAQNRDIQVIGSSTKLIWGRIKPILPYHFIGIAAVLLSIAVWDNASFADRIVKGIPSIFLVQMFPTGTHGLDYALIGPEWYLSAMYLMMLVIVPLFLVLRKHIRGVFASLCILCLVAIVVIGTGFSLSWNLPINFTFCYRAAAELSIGMLTYYLAQWLANKQLHLGVVEVIGYSIPLAMGILPMAESRMAICLSVTVLCSVAALAATFSGRGISTKNARFSQVCAKLGRWSLPIYIFHPVVIEALRMMLHMSPA